MPISRMVLALVAGLGLPALLITPALAEGGVTLGPRPYYLVEAMAKSELQARLRACVDGPFERTAFSIGHRGAALQFPEHTKESYEAAARMGAGIVECDATFTEDRQLVCRHAQCDLHTTTDILAIPDLAAKCATPFTPADPAAGKEASAKCCTSDLTLAEFKRLHGKMDGSNPKAATVEEYLAGTPGWRTDLYAPGTLMTHAESIELFKALGVRFTPELKAPEVPMPFEGDYTQTDYAQQLIDEYAAAGVDPRDVFAQSFNLDDVRYWLAHDPEFGAQAVFLDDRYDHDPNFKPADAATWSPTMAELKAEGVQIIAPPMWVLLALDGERIVPSAYARAARAAGLEIITWTLERSGPLKDGGGWYYQTVSAAIHRDGDMFEVLDVLAKQVGIRGIFSDWPATVTYYANCMGLK